MSKVAKSFICSCCLIPVNSAGHTSVDIGASAKLELVDKFCYLVVKAVRGILMRECANLYKSMKVGTLVIFDMLCPNLPGAKANSQWCHHIRQFKMDAA